MVETLRRSSEFAKGAVSIGGRSATALIGSPWQRVAARTNSAARTAQQLAGDALDLSGVALDWGLTDWLVSDRRLESPGYARSRPSRPSPRPRAGMC